MDLKGVFTGSKPTRPEGGPMSTITIGGAAEGVSPGTDPIGLASQKLSFYRSSGAFRGESECSR